MTIIEKFTKVTNYDLQKFFADYNAFLSNDISSLVSYFKGGSSLNKTAFSELVRLTSESNKIEHIISIFNTGLSATTEFWDLIDNLSEVKTRLETTINLAKWMRSSYVYGYDGQSKFKYILKQNQTFENLSKELGNADPNQDWVDLTIANGVMELDYTRAGGNVLDLSKTDNTLYNITTVVDVMVGDNILGKDMQRKVEILNDDFVSLTTQDTMEQSAEICLGVTQGSVPEYQSLGYPKDLVGSNINALRFSSLMRDVQNNFKTDDSFASVEMVDNGIDQDVAFYSFQITSRLNNQINKTI